MAELGTAYISIMPSSRGLGTAITSDLNSAAGPAAQGFGGAFLGKLKSVFGAAAIGKIVLDTFKQGAALEQSLGGIDTLYENAADTVKQYAASAWKEAGVSANTYMEQSTSYAASLLQSLGGDQAAAAKYADMAIKDMADNSAKMGTDLTMLQNAYAGFSKQNYTMLDNLKLGYGGTKSEMERLLAKAGELEGKEYNIDNLSDVYEAIHVIQKDLKLTGTAADEAETTLSGSFQSMKAALQDFMGNLVLGENVGASMANLADSAATFFFDNLVPAIGRIILSIPTIAVSLLSTVIPNIVNKITELINNFADGNIEGSAGKIVAKFALGLIKAIPTLIMASGKLTLALINAIMKLPAKMVDAGIAAIKGFVKGLKQIKLPKLKISWTTNSKGKGKNAISIPVPHISWNAAGGIFDRPTVLQGVGEAGAEAVVPLTQLWNRFDNMASQIASGVQTAMMMQTNDSKEIHLTLELGGSKVAEKIYKLNKQGEAALVG